MFKNKKFQIRGQIFRRFKSFKFISLYIISNNQIFDIISFSISKKSTE